MRIFHRIDDIGEFSEQMIDILKFFENNTKEFIIAVIPESFDKRYVEIIKTFKNCSVYQHGYKHENHVEKGWCDEFPDNIDYNQRLELITKGKEKIEEMLEEKIIGYVPPWNNTGDETIKIISELGFSIYSSQENNTVPYLNNKDILIDIISEYTPNIIYKNLNQVINKIITLHSEREELGIMYHFKDIKQEDWEKIKSFVIKVEGIKDV